MQRAVASFVRVAMLGITGIALARCSPSDTVATRGNSSGNATGGISAGTTGSGGSGASGATGGSGGNGGGVSGGAGGVGGSGGAAGTGRGGSSPPIRDASLDITFDWPEDAGKNPCKAGVYQGSFQCVYMAGDAGFGSFPVSGPISLKLVQSQQGEFLEVREGLLDGTANVFFTFRADISGRLNCRTSKFDGQLEHGVYSGFLVVNGTFQGPLSSDYDRSASQFSNGVWSLAVDMGNGGCNGTWSATYVGPGD
jgi:hypothetical protein